MKAGNHFTGGSRGFSLVELMIVMAIILLLAAIAIPRYLTAQQKAYEASAVSFLRTLQTEQEAYRLANGQYAQNFQQLGLYAHGPVRAPLDFSPEGMRAGTVRMRTLGPNAPPAVLTLPLMLPAEDSSAQAPPKQQGGQYGGGKDKEKEGGQKEGPGGPSVPGAGGSGGGSGGQPASGGASGTGSGGGSSGSGGEPSSGGGTPSGGSGSGQQPGGSGAGTGSGSPGSGSGGGTNQLPLNVVMKHNFVFTLERPTLTSYVVNVEPIRDRGFSRFFCMDQSGVIRSEIGRPATSTSPGL
jgi:prepilin-type N-terminal cleavage/methylation domain-containing protein